MLKSVHFGKSKTFDEDCRDLGLTKLDMDIARIKIEEEIKLYINGGAEASVFKPIQDISSLLCLSSKTSCGLEYYILISYIEIPNLFDVYIYALHALKSKPTEDTIFPDPSSKAMFVSDIWEITVALLNNLVM